tara:strand:+ start:274 stop:843 length:570 start_codon:yes stop_codon:yes gene_type:complete
MKNQYYHSKESVEEYIKLAEGVNGGELISRLKEFLPAQASLLEIGTGPGTDWNILKKDFKVVGSDNSKEFLNHLISKNPDGRFIELDAVSLNTDEQFDGVYSNKVLHHLMDDELVKSIQRQTEILNPKGIVCHSFWKGEGTEEFKGMFVNYHTEDSLKELFEKHFEILVMELYKEFEDGDSILLIGRKK